jgi:7,8-dihydropterin-6-yl-methyl-4-(beta-D-ribofuranosyl)aminobenzene 5'-phosphate synthase
MKKLLLGIIAAGLALVGGLAAFWTIRGMQAAAQVRREAQAPVPVMPALDTTSRLEIVPLYEAAGDAAQFQIGHGVSYLVRTDAMTILMDAGDRAEGAGRPGFIDNLRALGINWAEIDAVVISHAHPDHLGGEGAWRQGTLDLGGEPGVVGGKPLYVPGPLTYPGAAEVESTQPIALGPGIATTGALGYAEVFPISLFAAFGREQALMVNVAGKGLMLITGCGHPTIETLVGRAEALYGLPIAGVVGGLHYGEASGETLRPHIQFLAAREPAVVALSPHDSGLAVRQAFQAAFPEAYQPIEVGRAIVFP